MSAAACKQLSGHSTSMSLPPGHYLGDVSLADNVLIWADALGLAGDIDALALAPTFRLADNRLVFPHSTVSLELNITTVLNQTIILSGHGHLCHRYGV